MNQKPITSVRPPLGDPINDHDHGNDHHDHDGNDHDDFGGLHRDLTGLVSRRRALGLFGGVGLAGLVAACSGGGDSAGSSSTSSSTSATASSASTSASSSPTSTSASGAATSNDGGAAVAASAGTEIPDETAGPFPSDGSNGPNILTEAGVVRNDITTSIGAYSGTAEGVPTTLSLTVVDAATGDPLPGAAVYLWHCAAAGQYSIYEIADQNYLRGVAVADNAGRIDVATVLPGCYAGRWPHVHFEVFESVDHATSGSSSIKTTQLAVPQAACDEVYGSDDRYGNSAANLARLSLSSDMVFRDGWDQQLATATGTAADGYTLSLLVRV